MAVEHFANESGLRPEFWMKRAEATTLAGEATL